MVFCQRWKSSILSLNNGKLSSVNGIPGEVTKYGGDALCAALHDLTEMCEDEQLSQQRKDGRIISIYKRKGDRAVCSNNRETSLLAIAGKFLEKIRLMKFNQPKHCWKGLPWNIVWFSKRTGDHWYGVHSPTAPREEQRATTELVQYAWPSLTY